MAPPLRYQAPMKAYLLVFLGAGFGGMLRHGFNSAATRALGADFPWGIFLINVTGCLAMGLIAGWLAFRTQHGWTFSAFSLDFATLWERGAHTTAITYVLASVVLSLLAVFLGLAIVRMAS